MHIKQLTIYTNNLKAQVEFYTTVLDVKLIELTASNARLKFGNSILKLVYRNKTTPYHFAINIPANKENEALEWLRERVEILKDGEHEIQDFDFWNAKAIYFYDVDRNIVELIARKNLNNTSSESFNAHQFLELSEIGVPCTAIETHFNRLNELIGIEIFDGGFERFCAIGSENGLFICIDKTKKNWFPTNDNAFASEFNIDLVLNNLSYSLAFKNEAFVLL